MGNILKPLAKSILILLGLTAAASATNAAVQKKIFLSGFTTLIILNEEMEDIKKIAKSLQDPSLSINSVNEAMKNKTKEQKGTFLRMLLGPLAL